MILIMAAYEASAADADPLSDKVSLSLGTFLLDTSTRVRVDGVAGRGSEIDVERELGVRDSDSFRVDAYWRFLPRHKARILYFDTSRDASKNIERELLVRDTLFTLSTRVDTKFETRVSELAYEYTFLRGERYELAGSLGVHNLRFKLDLRTSGTGAGGTPLAETAHADGPLPVFGIHGVWLLNDRVFLEGQAQFFKISLDPYDGRLEDYNASIVWMAFRHVGVGVGYNEFVTRVDVSDDRFNGTLRWRYGGARIFVHALF